MAYRLKIDGYEILTALNGTEALYAAENHKPDLIILDIMMPDVSGIDVCRKLKSKESTKNIKILFLSAKGRIQDQEEGINAGADAYMKKPFRAKPLIDKISELLGDEIKSE